jgi:signal transduction histidine kinase
MVAVAALAVVAFFVPAALAIRSAQQRGELLALQREAAIVAARVPPSGPIDGSIFEPLTDSEHRLGLYGPDGRLLGGVGPATADRIVDVALEGNFAEGRVGNDLVAAVPVRVEPDGPLVMRIEAPRSDSRGRFLRSMAELAAAAAAVIAVAAAVGVWLARRLNRPIDELRRWAARPDAADPPDPTGIAELDSLRGDLLADRSRINELIQRERSFSSHVSHQLRTPVTAMRIALETELESPRSDPATVIGESLGQLDRLESTITSLLALARHDDRPPVEVDLTELVRQRVDACHELALERRRAITVEGRPAVVTTDAAAVEHIVDVLLDNALRHGRGAIQIRVSTSAEHAFVDVSDEGPAPHARDAFADRASDGGHGIGLRLARSLAESTGGRLELSGGATTTFRLSLPAQRGA